MPNMVKNKGITEIKCEELLNSRKAHADNGNNYNFIRTLLKKYNYIYKSYNDKIKLRLGYKENRYKIQKEDI